jgi:hypothetical protein
VAIVRLLFLEQGVSQTLKHRQTECAMMTPGLERAIEFVAHMLVLPSRIVGPEQQPKPKQTSLNNGEYKHIKERHACLSRTAATPTTRIRLGRCVSSISSLVWG